MNIGTGRLGNVQLLRGIAALMVVVLHSVGRAERAQAEVGPFGPFDPWGNAGVDLFFVISGFIMVYIHERKPRSPLRFLADRAARIVPLYWMILGLVVVMTLYGPLNMWEAGPGQPWTSFLFLSQALSDSRPILFLGWTLEYEAFFYCCFALAIGLAGRLGGRIDPLLPLAALIAVPVMVGMVDAIAMEFLFGALVARVLPHIPETRRSLIGWGALALGAAGLFASYGVVDAMEQRAILWGVPSTFILLGMLCLPQTEAKSAHWLGDSSYSLYLTHMFVLSWFYTAAVPGAGLLFSVTVIVATLIVAGLIHRYYEVPANRLAKRLLSWRPRARVAAA